MTTFKEHVARDFEYTWSPFGLCWKGIRATGHKIGLIPDRGCKEFRRYGIPSELLTSEIPFELTRKFCGIHRYPEKIISPLLSRVLTKCVSRNISWSVSRKERGRFSHFAPSQNGPFQRNRFRKTAQQHHHFAKK